MKNSKAYKVKCVLVFHLDHTLFTQKVMFLSKMTGEIKYLHKVFLKCFVKKSLSEAVYVDSFLNKM